MVIDLKDLEQIHIFKNPYILIIETYKTEEQVADDESVTAEEQEYNEQELFLKAREQKLIYNKVNNDNRHNEIVNDIIKLRNQKNEDEINRA